MNVGLKIVAPFCADVEKQWEKKCEEWKKKNAVVLSAKQTNSPKKAIPKQLGIGADRAQAETKARHIQKDHNPRDEKQGLAGARERTYNHSSSRRNVLQCVFEPEAAFGAKTKPVLLRFPGSCSRSTSRTDASGGNSSLPRFKWVFCSRRV
jgi:hypothetical protein